MDSHVCTAARVVELKCHMSSRCSSRNRHGARPVLLADSRGPLHPQKGQLPASGGHFIAFMHPHSAGQMIKHKADVSVRVPVLTLGCFLCFSRALEESCLTSPQTTALISLEQESYEFSRDWRGPVSWEGSEMSATDYWPSRFVTVLGRCWPTNDSELKLSLPDSAGGDGCRLVIRRPF